MLVATCLVLGFLLLEVGVCLKLNLVFQAQGLPMPPTTHAVSKPVIALLEHWSLAGFLTHPVRPELWFFHAFPATAS